MGTKERKWCVINRQYGEVKIKIKYLVSRNYKSCKRRQGSSTWPTQRLEYLPTLTTYIIVHSVCVQAWQRPHRHPPWINHLQEYQNILCIHTQHWGFKMVCWWATTNHTPKHALDSFRSNLQSMLKMAFSIDTGGKKKTNVLMVDFAMRERQSYYEDHVVCNL